MCFTLRVSLIKLYNSSLFNGFHLFPVLFDTFNVRFLAIFCNSLTVYVSLCFNSLILSILLLALFFDCLDVDLIDIVSYKLFNAISSSSSPSFFFSSTIISVLFVVICGVLIISVSSFDIISIVLFVGKSITGKFITI